MDHADFYIGLEFWMGGNQWRCTDVGSRTICAIKLDTPESWHRGPPFAVAEYCLDEDDILACSPLDGPVLP